MSDEEINLDLDTFKQEFALNGAVEYVNLQHTLMFAFACLAVLMRKILFTFHLQPNKAQLFHTAQGQPQRETLCLLLSRSKCRRQVNAAVCCSVILNETRKTFWLTRSRVNLTWLLQVHRHSRGEGHSAWYHHLV